MVITFLITMALMLSPAVILADGHNTESHYQAGPASQDGIGKFYMGREISHIMGHLGAGWLERSTREQEERTDLLVENMNLKPTDVVVDLGAGTGYFSFPMARRLTRGKLLAVDIQPEMLTLIQQGKEQLNIDNIQTILATETQANIPIGSADVVLLVDAYHEFSHPWEVMESVVKGLKSGGRIVLVEYRGEDRNVPIKRLHKMTQKQAKKEMQAVGLVWQQTDNYLPQQHVMIFVKP
jgi:ubiquinone/menaquinone biosynthesis C-methylase UbiE